MALGMTKLTNQSVLPATSVAALATTWATTPLNAAAGEMFMDVTLQISIAFDASATGDALLHIRTSSDDATTVDNDNTYAKTIGVSAGNTITVSHKVPGMFDYLDVGVENEDGTYALTATVIYSGSKMTGMA